MGLTLALLVFFGVLGVPIYFVFIKPISEEKAREREERARERRAANIIYSQNQNLAVKYGLPKYASRDAIQRKATEKFMPLFDNFCNANGIDRGSIINTFSSLGVCARTKEKLFYHLESAAFIGAETYWHYEYGPFPLGRIEELSGSPKGGSGASLPVSDISQRYHPRVLQNILNMNCYDCRSRNLSDIKMYRVEGGVHYVSNVSGGGANLQGAVVGGILAGGAGAIVGSQVGTNIQTTTEKKDERNLTLYYMTNGILKAEKIETSNIDKTLGVLRSLIPEKEESYLVTQRT